MPMSSPQMTRMFGLAGSLMGRRLPRHSRGRCVTERPRAREAGPHLLRVRLGGSGCGGLAERKDPLPGEAGEARDLARTAGRRGLEHVQARTGGGVDDRAAEADDRAGPARLGGGAVEALGAAGDGAVVGEGHADDELGHDATLRPNGPERYPGTPRIVQPARSARRRASWVREPTWSLA